MTLVDGILMAVLAGFALYGFYFGLIHTLGGLAGAVISLFIAAKLYLPLAASPFALVFGGNTNLGKIISFAIIYIVLARVIGLLVWVADKAFAFIKIVPFLSLANRITGLIFGMIEGALLLAGILYISGKYPIAESFGVALAQSKLASGLNFFIRIVEPLLPTWLAQLHSVFDAPSGKAAEYIREYFKF